MHSRLTDNIHNAQAYSLLLIGTHMHDGYELNVALLCGAGFLRAVSSSLVWVYSTLVIQSMVLGPQVRSVSYSCNAALDGVRSIEPMTLWSVICWISGRQSLGKSCIWACFCTRNVGVHHWKAWFFRSRRSRTRTFHVQRTVRSGDAALH